MEWPELLHDATENDKGKVREYTFSPFLKLFVNWQIMGRRLEDCSERLQGLTLVRLVSKLSKDSPKIISPIISKRTNEYHSMILIGLLLLSRRQEIN